MSYVIVLTDPDAPSRDDPKWSEFCHWIAVGTAKTSSKTAKSSSKKHKKHKKSKNHLKDLVKYKAPAPPPKTGKHRYVFLAFVAANGTTEKLHLSKPRERKHWGSEKPVHGVREWAHENGLAPVGMLHLLAELTEADMYSCEFHLCTERRTVISHVAYQSMFNIKKEAQTYFYEFPDSQPRQECHSKCHLSNSTRSGQDSYFRNRATPRIDWSAPKLQATQYQPRKVPRTRSHPCLP